MGSARSVIVLDFETTGLSPGMGDRAIEIGAARIENGRVTDRFQELMNPGWRISGFIEDYTGITNQMLQSAPPCHEVMRRFADFIGDSNLVAHNAAFDQRFLDAEFEQAGLHRSGSFACSMLAARRLYQEAPNHTLGNIVSYVGLTSEGAYHRALYDSEMTAKLWMSMLDTIDRRYAVPDISFGLMKRLTKTPKKSVDRLFESRSKEPLSATVGS
ncbi:MAG: DNA polymerase III subunit epsilon [Opitutales bacterium TMED158]|nr:MAG: DNA polymerase III subunit epsilon [Opitutales bacterium TMED158]